MPPTQQRQQHKQQKEAWREHVKAGGNDVGPDTTKYYLSHPTSPPCTLFQARKEPPAVPQSEEGEEEEEPGRERPGKTPASSLPSPSPDPRPEDGEDFTLEVSSSFTVRADCVF